MAHHVAQFNYASMRYDYEDPEMKTFSDRLEEINALADAAPGFVWRLQTEEGDSTALRPLGENMLVNLSVWESVEALKTYAYSGEHVDILRRRREWFEKMETPHLVLWWVEEGQIPTIDEARERLTHLTEHGPSEHAFTFASLPTDRAVNR